MVACTAYSCQVMDAEQWDAELETSEGPEASEGSEGRARLSKRAVVDRALKLADADGLDALTIRKLTQDLGVTPMALYWHFRSKDELLQAMAEEIWSQIYVHVDPSVPWWLQLQSGLESLIAVLRAHPAAPQLMVEKEKQNEPAMRTTEAALEILRSAGFDPEYAAEIARSTLWTGISLVMSEAGYHPELSEEERAEHQRLAEVYFAMQPVARYPRLVECAAPMSACDPDFHYRLGVELFIAGVRAIADRQRDAGEPR
jgi:TetR/AcrR family transcriptional regulator, tetracycline repressor protein